MGCAGSKLDDLEAVALCRYRLQFLTEAIEQRYALAGAHASYIQSLHSIGSALHRFFLINELPPPHSASPVLTLPTQRKGDPSPLPPLSPLYPIPTPSPSIAVAAGHQHSHSNSGSHIQFRSSEEDDDSEDDDDGVLHSGHGSPFPHADETDDTTPTKTTTTAYFNFAKKGAASSSTVTYEQKPFSSDVSHVQFAGFGDPHSSASTSTYGHYYGDPYSMNQSLNYYGGGGESSNSHPYAYPPPYAYTPAYDGYFKSSPPAPPPVFAQPPPSSSTQRDPPPPPSPPRASPWEFLNPFESYQSYQPAYTPSRSSRDLREEEGIPDLEDEEQEIVKEAYGDQKSAAGASSSNANTADVQSSAKGVVVEEDARSIGGEEMRYQRRAGEGAKMEAQMTDKNVMVDEMLQRQTEGGLRRKVEHGSRSVRDVVHEIEAQFDRASASCQEIGKMLEVGKLQYHRRKYEVVSSKVRHAITPSLSTTATSKTSTSMNNEHPESDSLVYLDFDEEKGMKAGNLSSTLQKIYVWEKKLLEEVKAEEKMRLCHDRERKRLKRLDDRGAEPQKIDSSRALVMKLSTKIKIAIQVVDGISNRIHKLRDEELWPELHELIQGLVGMWQAMTECHRSQFQAVMESKNLDAAKYSFVGNLYEDQMDSALQLVLELVNWIDIFSSWINSQKCFVRSLNGWLMKILPDEQEETADGIAPFSPGRLGAPPVFVICNYWSQAIERITELEVLEAIRSFTSSVMQVRQQGIMASQSNDRRSKAFERDDQKIYKAVDAINKRLMQVTIENGLPCAGEIIYLKPDTEKNSLKGGLQKIFEATKRFSEQSMNVYEELRARCDEESSRANG